MEIVSIMCLDNKSTRINITMPRLMLTLTLGWLITLSALGSGVSSGRVSNPGNIPFFMSSVIHWRRSIWILLYLEHY